MTQTTNYQLNQWEATDQVQRVDFNADNAKIDAAIGAVDAKADALAETKADQSALTALSQTVAGHTSALSQKGNCRIYTTTYTGNNASGESGAVSLSFPGKPELVAVIDPNSGAFIVMIYGCPYTQRSNSTSSINVSWGGNGVRWWSNDGSHFNRGTYPVVALISLG